MKKRTLERTLAAAFAMAPFCGALGFFGYTPQPGSRRWRAANKDRALTQHEIERIEAAKARRKRKAKR